MSLDWMAIFTLNEQLMAFLCIESLEAVVRPLGPCSNKRSSLHRVVNVFKIAGSRLKGQTPLTTWRARSSCGLKWHTSKLLFVWQIHYKPPSGRCVAGREILPDAYGGWIRPVSARETAEVSFAEYSYENRQTPQLLDIIEVPLLRPEPRHHQTENHVISGGRWVKKGQLPWSELEAIRDEPESLWINSDSTNAGHYDRISQAEAATVHDSLVVIRPENFSVEVGRNYWTGKKSFRGTFNYNGPYHNLSVTDPTVRDVFGAKEEGDYPWHDVYLCVSLTEPYEHDDKCHKLVAAIISQEPFR